MEQISLVRSSNVTWFDTTVHAHLFETTVFFLWGTFFFEQLSFQISIGSI